MQKELKQKNELFKEKLLKGENFKINDLRRVNCIASSYAGGEKGTKLFQSILSESFVTFQYY